MANTVPLRSEIAVEDTWNLSDLYPSIADWESDLHSLTTLTDTICSLQGQLTASASNLLKAVSCFSELECTSSKAFQYADRLYDEDTTNVSHQAMTAKISSLYAEIGSRLAFFDPEILEMPSDTLEKFYQECPELTLYRNFLKEIQRLKPHTLSTELEQLLALSSEMRQTASNTFEIFSDADLKFGTVTKADGETVALSHGRFVRLLESSDRTLRKQVFQTYYATYKQFLNTFASLYDGQVKQQLFRSKARKYTSSLEAAVDLNNVPVSVYHTLIATVNQNLDKLHRYVKLRKQCLQVEELHMYDIYTPMIAGIAKTYTFEEAKSLVLDALAPLGADYLSVVKEAFANRWVDVYENQGKRSGAYSSCAYGYHPYVLLNFNGSLDDVFTLAHEMGHAMHSYYSDKAQPYLDSQYKIFVAEVASTCNEILLLEHLLNITENPKERAYLLNHYLDMFKGTLFRQTQFAEFELRTNTMVEQGESLNAENLSALYLEINKTYYGTEMISDAEIAYEWARIPHFYYDFYVYQYATSFSAAVAIAHEILQKGTPVVEAYLDLFLSGGCSESPIALLKRIGMDMESPAPVQEALEVMGEVLTQLEELTK